MLSAPLSSLKASSQLSSVFTADEEQPAEQRSSGKKRRTDAASPAPQELPAPAQQNGSNERPRPNAKREAADNGAAANGGAASDFFMPVAQKKRKVVGMLLMSTLRTLPCPGRALHVLLAQIWSRRN